MSTPAVLSPSPVQRFYDNSGNPLANGTVSTYSAGTTTPIATYVDSTATTTNANPIVLNARGEASIWLLPNVAYKYMVKDANGNPISTTDQITVSQLLTLYGGVDTGSTNAYILNFTANFSAYTDGIVIYWIPSHNNTGASTLNVNGLGMVNITNQNGSALQANQLVANQTATIMYEGGAFLLLSSGNVSFTWLYYGGTDTGTANAYVLTIPLAFNSYVNGIEIDWIPAHTNTGASTMDVNGLGIVNINNADGSALAAGELIAGVITKIIYQGSGFVLLASSTSGTFTGTLTGVASGAVTVAYWINNRVCTLRAGNIVSTSTSTALTMTGLPAIVTPQSGASTIACLLNDNSAAAGGWAQVNSGTGTITFGIGINNNQSGFTGSANKGLGAGWSVTYALG